MDLGLNKKTIFISGGSSGIGKATALTYAEEQGAQIAISYYSGEAEAHQIVNEIEKKGCKAIAVYLDLADHESIKKAVDTAINEFGTIDVLINNAVNWGKPEHREGV